MKSIILNLQEDLTDAQIDKLIAQLESKKKVKPIERRSPKIIFTKQEKKIFEKIEKLTNTGEGYFSKTADQYDNLETFRKGVIGYMKKELAASRKFQKGEIDGTKLTIKEYQKVIKNWEKYISDIDKSLKEVDTLDNLLKKKIKRMK